MEAQLHHTHGRDYDDHLHPADAHGEEERGGETRSTMQKVKEKVDKLKTTIMHGHGRHGGGEHKDDAQTMNDSPVVRCGLAEPTVMGMPVLAEDLYATHSDIVDPPVRSFARWEEEERHGSPPPLSTDYGTHLTEPPHVGDHTYGQNVNTEQSEGGIWKPAVLDEEERDGAPPPLFTGFDTHLTDPYIVGYDTFGDQVVNRDQLKGSTEKSSGVERHGAKPPQDTGTYGTDLTGLPSPPTTDSPANLQSDVTDTTNTGGKEVGITDVLKSFDKMKVFEEPDTKSSKSDQNKPLLYSGSHDQFAAEPVEKPPLDTIAESPSKPSSSYAQRMSSTKSSITDKAYAVRDSIVSKLSPSKTTTRSSFPTDFSHKVADTLSGTLGPVYEKVAETGSRGKGVTMKEYLVDTFKPGDDDKMLSEVITHALHRGKGNHPTQDQASTTTSYVIRDEGEKRLQDSGN